MKKIRIGNGQIIHIKRKGMRQALCGAKSGRGSVHSEIVSAHDDDPITCNRCLASLEVLREKARKIA